MAQGSPGYCAPIGCMGTESSPGYSALSPGMAESRFSRWAGRRGMAESRFSLAAGDGGVPVLSDVRNRANSFPLGTARTSSRSEPRELRSPGSPGGPGGGGWRSPGSLLALAGEGSGIRGDPSEFKGRPIARLNRIGNLRASVEEFLEFARRGSANGTPLEVDSGERFSSASGGPRGPPWNFSGRCAGHGG